MFATSIFADVANIEFLRQKFFPFQSLGFKYTQQDFLYENGKEKEVGFENTEVLYEPSTGNLWQNVRRKMPKGDGLYNTYPTEITYSLDGITTRLIDIPDNRLANIDKSSAGFPTPFSAWMLGLTETLIDTSFGPFEIKLDKSANLLKVTKKDYLEFWFDVETFDLKKGFIYSLAAGGKVYLSSEQIMEDYIQFGPYRIATKITFVYYNDDGTPRGNTKIRIDGKSITANSNWVREIKMFLPPGTRVEDSVKMKTYLVTEATDVDKKEDAIVKILNDMLDEESSNK